jgi:uncharacterized protein involved in exopolysaccharide biosynthesis
MDESIIKNIQYYLGILRARPLRALVPAVLALLVGAAFVMSLPRTYYADALLIVEGQQIPSSLVTTTVASERMQFIEQRVLAREKLLALADRFGLFPALRETMSDSRLAELMRQHIVLDIQTVVPGPSEQTANSAALRIGFKHTSPKIAADVASALVAMIVEENKQNRVARASETTQFLEREVNTISHQLQEKDAAWRTYFESNKDVLPSRIPALLAELQERERELTQVSRDLPESEQSLGLLQAQLRLGASQSESLTRSRNQLAALQTDLAQKSLVYSDTHPEVRSLKQQIAVLQQQEAAEASAHAASASAPDPQKMAPELRLFAERIAIAEPRHQALVARRDELNRRITELRTVMLRAPDVEAQLRLMDRDRQGLQDTLDQMRGKLETARVGERLEQDQTTSQIQVVERPEVPNYPISPNRTKLLLVVLVGAVAAGAAGLYLGDAFSRTIRGAFDLNDALAGETLVVIPEWKPQRHAGIARSRMRGRNAIAPGSSTAPA